MNLFSTKVIDLQVTGFYVMRPFDSSLIVMIRVDFLNLQYQFID